MKIGDVELRGVATATGLSGAETARRFGFAYSTTDHKEVLADPETDTVFIATRHDLHAPLICEALEAGKHVFVEKPLAISEEQFERVIACAEAHPELVLMVGFNRRFAPLVIEAQKLMAGRTTPLVMLYRVNAGPVPKESWIQGEEGGGRVVGEVCHFVDTLAAVAGSPPTTASLIAADGQPDAVSLQLCFADGSIGTVIYTSLGDPSLPKEYIEAWTTGRVAVIDDFRKGSYTAAGKTRKLAGAGQDKGFVGELSAFFDAVRSGSPSPVPLEALAATTKLTLTST
jgi:predicted dehydrogenase